MIDSAEAIARDVEATARISAVPSLLKIVCANSGLRFAAVARVTDGTWTACAVEDNIDFGLQPGGQLDVHTTLCKESRAARQPVVIDHASEDPLYRDRHTPRPYGIESYISLPIVRPNGDYFGNLCAIDPRPARVSDARTVAMFNGFAELIGRQLDQDEQRAQTASALLDAEATAELREQFIAVLGHDLAAAAKPPRRRARTRSAHLLADRACPPRHAAGHVDRRRGNLLRRPLAGVRRHDRGLTTGLRRDARPGDLQSAVSRLWRPTP